MISAGSSGSASLDSGRMGKNMNTGMDRWIGSVLHSIVDDAHLHYRQQNLKFSGCAFRPIIILRVINFGDYNMCPLNVPYE